MLPRVEGTTHFWCKRVISIKFYPFTEQLGRARVVVFKSILIKLDIKYKE